MVKFKDQNCITTRRARLQLTSITHFNTKCPIHLPCTNKLKCINDGTIKNRCKQITTLSKDDLD